MKLEISHPEGTPHEVELTRKVTVIGRDPACDVVLSDSRCSRRHAIIEQTAEGLVVQDAGSANGVFVNGRRLERSPLKPGDSVRIGDTVLQVPPEPGETAVIAPQSLDLPGEATAPPPSPSAEPAPSVTPSRARSGRPRLPPAAGRRARTPLTVTVLALLWAILVPAAVAGGIALAFGEGGPAPGDLLWAGAGLLVGALAGLMAVGLWTLSGWSRHLQVAAAAFGLLACPFTFASVTILIYMLRPDVRSTFEGGPERRGAGEAELTFALSLLGMVLLGVVATAVVVVLL